MTATSALEADTMLEGNQVAAQIGSSVASAGDVNGDGFDDVLGGSSGYTAGTGREGMVALYPGSPSGPLPSAWSFEGSANDAKMGYAVASAGDVNGDGYADVLAGAPGEGSGVEGRVVLFLGSAAGLRDQPDWTFDGEHVGAKLGASVASVGDTDGDGYADVAVVDNDDPGELIFADGFENGDLSAW